MKRLDYEAEGVAEAFDRGRSGGSPLLEQWMRTVGAHVRTDVRAVLDLGCGTGRFSEALARRFNARVAGMDMAARMLKRAIAKRTDARVAYFQGRGEAVALSDASVDLVFMSMVFHHFSDPGLAARECRRVLRAGGYAVVRTGTREHIADYAYVAYFPGTRGICEQRLPSNGHVRDVFAAAGFQKATAEIVTQEIAAHPVEYAEKLTPESDSVLASLDPEEFATGLAALKAAAARSPDTPVLEPIDLFVFC